MKLTKTKLKQIIKEELEATLLAEYDLGGAFRRAGRKRWDEGDDITDKELARQRKEERAHPGATPSEDPLCASDRICQKVCGILEACEKSKGQQLGGCTMHANLKQLMKRGKPATATMNLEAWRQDCKLRKERATPAVGGLGG